MKATARVGGRGRWARPKGSNGLPIRASIYRKRGPWNPSPLGFMWVVPALARIGLIAMLTGLTFIGTSPTFTAYVNSLPDVRQVAARSMTEDTLIYASDGTTLLADLHPSGRQQYFQSVAAMGKYLPMAVVARSRPQRPAARGLG